MSGLDSDILREKIKQKMPKPPKFSFGLKAFLAAAIISMVLLLLVGGSFIAVIPAGHVGVLDPAFRSKAMQKYGFIAFLDVHKFYYYFKYC